MLKADGSRRKNQCRRHFSTLHEKRRGRIRGFFIAVIAAWSNRHISEFSLAQDWKILGELYLTEPGCLNATFPTSLWLILMTSFLKLNRWRRWNFLRTEEEWVAGKRNSSEMNLFSQRLPQIHFPRPHDSRYIGINDRNLKKITDEVYNKRSFTEALSLKHHHWQVTRQHRSTEKWVFIRVNSSLLF